MIDIEIDGFYCEKCKELHPMLFWHKLYDEYIKPEKDYIIYIKQISEKFGNRITDKEATKLYQEYRTSLGVEFCAKPQSCIVCRTNTHCTTNSAARLLRTCMYYLGIDNRDIIQSTVEVF